LGGQGTVLAVNSCLKGILGIQPPVGTEEREQVETAPQTPPYTHTNTPDAIFIHSYITT